MYVFPTGEGAPLAYTYPPTPLIRPFFENLNDGPLVDFTYFKSVSSSALCNTTKNGN